MLEFGFGFIFGSLVGSSLSFLACFFIIFYFLLDSPTQEISHLQQKILQKEEEDRNKINDVTRYWNVYADKQIHGWNMETRASAPGEEKCTWFNLLKQRIFQVFFVTFSLLKFRNIVHLLWK